MYRFDEASLLQSLMKIPHTSKQVFSVCCASRQKSVCELFAKKFMPEYSGFFENTINRIWNEIIDGAIRSDWLETLESVMEAMPEEQDQWAPLHIYAEHGMASLAYCIRFLLKNNVQEIVWAARRAYEAADQAAIRDLRASDSAAESEEIISAHKIVQRELRRQQRDLNELRFLSTEKILSLKKVVLNEKLLELEEMDR